MENLKVLDIEGMSFLQPFWTSLKNLRTLFMSYCECEDIDAIGHLKELEILRICNCEGITELPTSMSELKELKVLVVLDCSNLVVIHKNFISSMTKLEELDIQGRFTKWREKYLKILENSETPHLRGNDFTSLEWLVLKGMVMLESIVPRHSPTNPFNKLKVVEITRCKQLRNFFSLSIFKGLSNLREIKISECDMMEEIVSIEIEDQITICTSPLTSLHICHMNKLASFCSTKSSIQQTIVPFFDERRVSFPQLEDLSIFRANNLEMLWHKNGTSFSKLQTVEISYCKKLRCVFPSNIVTSLVSLDTLEINCCGLLEMIFEIEKPKTSCDTKVVVPLRHLYLQVLPSLKYVWDKDGDDVVAFPNLKKVEVSRCPKLRSIFPPSFTKYMKEIEELIVEDEPIFPVEDEASKLKEVALFQSLKTLKMSCKEAVDERFWVMSKFFKLKRLELVGCEDDDDDDDKMISLPMEMSEVLYSIEELTIRGCLQLIGSLQGMRHLELSLKSVKKSFWHKSESVSKLIGLTMIGCEDDDIVCLPLEMSELLYNIEEFIIEDAHKLVQVFENEELSRSNNNDVQRCAKLKNLTLITESSKAYACVERK
ncbi:hypothetical protein Csa_021852 [Cucumis sativus]|nr:hypothetical protein Csa_021852 [Cucumis sativus]